LKIAKQYSLQKLDDTYLALGKVSGLRMFYTQKDGQSPLKLNTVSLGGKTPKLSLARPAIWFGRPTSKTVEAAEKRPVVYSSIMGTSANKLVLSMGGELLYLDGEMVGAVGSAGASEAEDIQVSQRCVEIWNSLHS
jgi:uncharacterized protein GlcG (DUF336 family)